MLSNKTKYNYHKRIDFLWNIQQALKTYFKALNLNYSVMSTNNSMIRIRGENEVFNLKGLFKMLGVEYNERRNRNVVYYEIYVL